MIVIDPMPAAEGALLDEMQDAIAEAGQTKVSLADMLGWADDQETRERNALLRAAMANGYVPRSRVRPLAVARKLVDFLRWCDEHRQDLETLFRAKEHLKKRWHR